MDKRKYPNCDEPLRNPAECDIPSICPGCPDPSLDAGWETEGGERYRTLCPHCAGVLPEQDAITVERDALKAKLAEIETWCRKVGPQMRGPQHYGTILKYLLDRFFPEVTP